MEGFISIQKVNLTLGMLNIFMYYTPPQFYPVNLQHSRCKHMFSIREENSVDPDQMASSEPADLERPPDLSV